MITLLMGLQDRFESVRAAFFHRNPLPSLADAVTKLLSKDTRLRPKPQNTNIVMAVHNQKSAKKSSLHACIYCQTLVTSCWIVLYGHATTIRRSIRVIFSLIVIKIHLDNLTRLPPDNPTATPSLQLPLKLLIQTFLPHLSPSMILQLYSNRLYIS